MLNLDALPKTAYRELYTKHLLSGIRAPKKYELQNVPVAELLEKGKYGPGELDDGLMYIGQNYCLSKEPPKCGKCPISDLCVGNTDSNLIEKYNTAGHS